MNPTMEMYALIPADLRNVHNAKIAAERISEMLNAVLREDIFNLMNLPPIGGTLKFSLSAGPAVPTPEGIEQVRITASVNVYI